MPSSPQLQRPRIKPPALHPGDAIGIVAPASNVQRENLEAGCNELRRMGYKPLFSDSIFDKDLYFAGSLQRRVRELEDMFTNDEVRAILCARGGYGANYLLGRLDVAKILAHPKIFVGYSDLSSLMTFFTDRCGLVTFHGPMAAKDFDHADGVDLASWNAALSGQSAWELTSSTDSGATTLLEGEAEGILYGGCLSILSASLGTPYEIETAGAILFLEDVAAKPFQIDRMLMQLKLAGKLKEVRGIIFGEMLECIQTQNQDYTLQEIVLRVVGDLGIPVAYGLRSGHVSRANITLPLGVRAALSARPAEVTLKILEAATTLPRAGAKA
jgi:muramoyltetrapeptide carboxypeptidase